MAIIGVNVVTLSIDIESVHLQEDVQGFDDRLDTRLVRHIDDHRAPLLTFELEVIERLGIFGGLPGEIKIAKALVTALLLGVEDRADERRREHLQLVSRLREDQADDLAPGNRRLRPADAVDVRIQFQLHMHRVAHIRMSHGETVELGLADLKIARAPAEDLNVFALFDRLRQRDRFQSGPELFLGAGDDREVGREIDPLHFGIPPFAAAVALDAHQRSVVQSVGGRQDFTRSDDDSRFYNRLNPLGPGLEVIVLFAVDFDADNHALPVAGGFLRHFAAETGRRRQRQANCEPVKKSKPHNRRSLGTP